MLNQEQIAKIKAKIKREYLTNSIISKRMGVSRQMISLLLLQKATSKSVEDKLIKWANEK